jgi:hypothetical protein
MRTDYSKMYTRQLVPVVAMLVAYAWASFAGQPTLSSSPYPLPANEVASAPAHVQAN